MPNCDWTRLNALQIGRYAEYYTKMEFASYGFEVYTSEVDDHGIDFVAKKGNGPFYEIQVKSVRNLNYIFFPKINLNFEIIYMRLLLFSYKWKCRRYILFLRLHGKIQINYWYHAITLD